MLITFEGIDGCGKSTQIRMLHSWFDNQGVSPRIFREPGGVELAEQIREILLHSKQELSPVSELLLFSAARSQLVEERVRPLIDNGVAVILDRFYDSTTAYQGYGRNALSLEDIEILNRIASHGLKPDITFYLKIDYKDAIKRTMGSNPDRIERSGEEFYNKVISGYDDLAKKEPRFIVLDAMQSPSQVHQQVLQSIKKVLSD